MNFFNFLCNFMLISYKKIPLKKILKNFNVIFGNNLNDFNNLRMFLPNKKYFNPSFERQKINKKLRIIFIFFSFKSLLLLSKKKIFVIVVSKLLKINSSIKIFIDSFDENKLLLL